jgi:hypothetical protein
MIFESDDDRRVFLSVLDEVCETFNWEHHAYCLVGNHYPLSIESISRALVHSIVIWLVLLLGCDQFVNSMQRRIEEPNWLSEMLFSHHRFSANSIKHYVDVVCSRNAAIVLSYSSGGHGMTMIWTTLFLCKADYSRGKTQDLPPKTLKRQRALPTC